MQLEFEFTQKDCLKRHLLLTGARFRISQCLIALLLTCSSAQIYLIWQELNARQFWILFTIIALFNVYILFRVFRARRLPPYRCQLDFRDSYMYEKSNETEYQKAYSFLREVVEERNYILIHHPGNVVLIPKRVLDPTQLDWIRNELRNRIANAKPIAVPFYEESFQENKESAFGFRWEQEDLKHLEVERFTPYEPGEAIQPTEKGRNIVIGRQALAALMLFPGCGTLISAWMNSSLLPVPLGVFILGMVALHELAYFRQNRGRRKQADHLLGSETEFYVSADAVWIGEGDVVNRHSLKDIVRVFFGRHFVALQSHERLLYVLPTRAIGDRQSVQRFLDEVSRTLAKSERIETGNPYQPPTL